VPGAAFEPFTASAIVAGTLISGALFLHALSFVEDGFDPMMTWDTNARYVRAARTVDAPVFFDEKVFLNNPRYPLLMPLMQVAIQEVFDTNEDERVFRPAYAIFFPVFLLVLFDTASIWAGRRAAALAALVAALLPLLSFNIEGGAVSSYSDLPLACFWGGGFLLLLSASPLSFSSAIGAGLLLAGAVLTKAEGLLLSAPALAVAGAGSLIGLRGAEMTPAKRRSLAACFAAAGLLVVAAAVLYASWRRLVPDRHSFEWDQTTLSGVARGTISVFPRLLRPIAREMGDRETWERFWWLAPVVLFVGWRGLRRRVSLTLGLAIASGLFIYFLSYGGTNWPAADLVHPTWNRLMIQQSLPFFVIFALCLREALFPDEEARPSIASSAQGVLSRKPTSPSE
jgi:hypothetical protein